MSLRHPIARVRGLGSAKDGTGHWVAQRITAVALMPLVAWLVVAAFGLGAYADARAFLAQPLNAVLTAALVVCVFHHAQLGLQVVIEDYVHLRWLEVLLQVLVKFTAFLAGLASLLAIVRIVLGS